MCIDAVQAALLGYLNATTGCSRLHGVGNAYTALQAVTRLTT